MRRFVESDYETLSEWFKARNQPVPEKHYLPRNGLIVEGVGAGFLVLTDCQFGVLDFFVTNPYAQQTDRLSSLGRIATGLMEIAKTSGMRAVRCDTRFENIKRLANHLNFTYLGELSLFAKEL